MTGNRRQRTSATTYMPERRRIGDAGWEYVHIAIDDCTRLAYAEALPDEKVGTATAFLRRAIAFYRRHGIRVERLIIDNDSAYRAAIRALACRGSTTTTITADTQPLATSPRSPASTSGTTSSGLPASARRAPRSRPFAAGQASTRPARRRRARHRLLMPLAIRGWRAQLDTRTRRWKCVATVSRAQHNRSDPGQHEL